MRRGGVWMSTDDAREHDMKAILSSLRRRGRTKTMDLMHAAGFVTQHARLLKVLKRLEQDGKVIRHGIGKGAGYEWELAPKGHVPPPEVKKVNIELNEREFAAVLCGLRLLQEKEGSLTYEHLDILSNCGSFARMQLTEIDELCERINSEEDR